MTTRLIFSSSASDRGFTDRLQREIKKRGMVVVEPRTTLASGTKWAEAIRRALESSDALVLVVPEEGTPGANNAFFELGVASALGKPVLAVRPDRSAMRRKGFHEDSIAVLIDDAAKKPIESVVDKLVDALA